MVTPGANYGSSSRPDFIQNWQRRLVRIAFFALCLLLIAGSVVFVDETELVLIERFGVIVQVYDRTAPNVSDRGLHFKLPWPVEIARRFDRRLQWYDPRGREMFTSDRKNIIVDTYVCWRIAPESESTKDKANRSVVRFYRSLGNISTTEARLDTRVRAVLSEEMGRLALSDLLSAADSESAPGPSQPLAKLSERVKQLVQKQSSETESITERLGIEIVDVGIQRINLPEGNLFAVYERMRKERDKIAQRYRSAGEAEKLIIESQARRRSAEVLAKANTEAARIRALGEAESLRIRNTAHSRDPEFYAWLRNLESYQKILSNQTTLVIASSSPFLQVLMAGVPESPAAVVAPSTSAIPSKSRLPRNLPTDEAVPPSKARDADRPATDIGTSPANPQAERTE